MSANEISPRRHPRSPALTPPRWKKPEDVMRKHKVKMKESALLARMDSSPTSLRQSGSPFKRKNPFRGNEAESQISKKQKPVETVGEDSLLEILGCSELQPDQFVSPLPYLQPASVVEKKEVIKREYLTSLPVDWTLRFKMRFISPKPFPWSLTLKTCEEASGITGFVRCIDWRSEPRVDTSLNGQFHQACLVWVQPNLPWLQVFPRHNIRKAGKFSPFLTNPPVRDALYEDWAKSLRSLFQLVRARHCPYFYMVTSSFTCLFRAAGINGTTEINVMICPTTRGFRKLLTADGIEYTLPLRVDKQRSSVGAEDEEDNGMEADSEKVDDDEGDWLSSLGISEAEVIRETQETVIKKDDTDETLVRVEGGEAQALLNFLINCKSVVETGGPLSGVPPTLLSPVAFPGGTLTPLKVAESTVKVDNERYYTMEVRGPVLPNTIINLTSILDQQLETFSVTCANIEPTKSFTLVKEVEPENGSPSKISSAFDKGALTDSGLDAKLLTAFCSSNLKTFDCIRFSGGYQVM